MTSTLTATDPEVVPAPADLVAHHLLHRALRREFVRLPALLMASGGADVAVRLRVVAHGHEFLDLVREHRAGNPSEVDGVVTRIDALLDRFPVLDTVALTACFTRLAELVRGAEWCAAGSPAALGPRRRRHALLGHLLLSADQSDRAAVLDSPAFRRAWTRTGQRRFRAELDVIEAIGRGELRRAPRGIRA